MLSLRNIIHTSHTGLHGKARLWVSEVENKTCMPFKNTWLVCFVTQTAELKNKIVSMKSHIWEIENLQNNTVREKN